MNSSLGCRFDTVFAVLLLLTLAGTAYAQVDRKDIVRRARGSYYSLKQRGLSSFQCDLSPNWDLVFQKARKTHPQAADHAVSKLSQIRFHVSMGTAGSAKVTHTTVVPDNAGMAKTVDGLSSDIELMVTTFFEAWSPFMITTPFPEVDSDFALADYGDHWALTYKKGPVDVETTMDKDLLIREQKTNSPRISRSLRPQFVRSPKGLMLSAYQDNFVEQSPSKTTTKLQVGISYQVVNGFQLPLRLELNWTNAGTPFRVQITFTGCQAKGR